MSDIRNYFAQRIKHTGSRLKEVNAEQLVIGRGEYRTEWIWGTPAGTDSRTLERFGMVITQEIDQVWSVDADDLVFSGGQKFVPENGDQVQRINGEVYTVVTNNDQTYRYTTSNRDRILLVTIRTTGRTPLSVEEAISS